MGSTLDAITFGQPEFGRFEDVHFLVRFLRQRQVKWKLYDQLFLEILLGLSDLKIVVFWSYKITAIARAGVDS